MKKYLSILGMTLLFFSCQKELTAPLQNDDPEAIIFTSTFTKVLVDGDSSSWELSDSIGIFSYANTATSGQSVSANFQYKAGQAGASTTFSPAASSVTASDKYIAYYPYTKLYPNKLNAATSVGFAGSTAGVTPVTDYRHIPFGVNSGATMTVDPVTHKAPLSMQNFYYAQANAPASSTDPVVLTFKPVLPVLEFGFYGKGKIMAFTASYKDKATDVIGTDSSNWLTAKGIFDASTSTLITTNSSASAYCKINNTINGGTELNTTEATRFPLVVGRFKVTKGLNLEFTDDHGYKFSKTIWEGNTYSGVNGEGTCVHLYQKVNVPYLVADKDSLAEFAVAGGSKDIVLESTGGNWSLVSKPEWISLNSESGSTGATVTVTAATNDGSARSGLVVLGCNNGPRCYIAVSQAAATVAEYYKITKSSIEWTSSKVKYILASNGDTLAVVTKEFLDKTNPGLSTVIYSKDFIDSLKVTGDCAYVCTADGSASLTEPSGTIGTAGYADMVLVAPSGEINPLVKVGVRLYTINGYKTTICGDGTELTVLSSAAASSARGVYKGTDYYLYTGYAVGASVSGSTAVYTEGFAPEGWSMIQANVWGYLQDFLGSDTSAYNNFMTAGLYTRNSYKVGPAQLGYINTWSTAVSGAKLKMLMIKPANAPSSSAQNLTAMFETIIYKRVQ